MADEASQDDKTEQPTEKKLGDAVEKGNLPISREVALFGFLLSTMAICTLMLRDGVARLLDQLSRLMDNPGGWSLENAADAAALLGATTEAMASFVTPILILFIAAGLAIAFTQHMPRFVLSRIAPKPEKLSPMAGLKRLFGRDGVIQFGKSLFKLTLVASALAFVVSQQRDLVLDALFVDPIGIAGTMLTMFVRLLSGVLVIFALLVAADIVISRMTWNRSMLMSRREIKDEVKAAEGDPLVKAKRRSLAMDRARRRMMKQVPRATMVIANPTHYAIALRYVREEMAAPVVVAKGQDLIALKIREIAEEHGIAVIEDKLLARSMYDHVDVAKAIPPQFYKAVAEIIHYLTTKKNSKKASLERSQVLR